MVAEESITKEDLRNCAGEFIGRYKQQYLKGETDAGLYHLFALEHLCNYGETQGLDCSWIYEAFQSELENKHRTKLRHFYLGCFTHLLIESGCNTLSACLAISTWADVSNSTVDAAYRRFLVLHKGWAPVEISTLTNERVLKNAAAFINAVDKPFPKAKGKKNQVQEAFRKLSKQIKNAGLQNEQPPFSLIKTHRKKKA